MTRGATASKAFLNGVNRGVVIRRSGSKFIVEDGKGKTVFSDADQKVVERWAEKNYDSIRYSNMSPFQNGRMKAMNEIRDKCR